MKKLFTLTNHAAKVTLIHRRDTLRSEKYYADRLMANDQIEVLWDTVVDEVLGEEDPLGVTGLVLRNVKTEEKSILAIHGLFVAIGHDPATKRCFNGKVDMDQEGYIITAPDYAHKCSGRFRCW